MTGRESDSHSDTGVLWCQAEGCGAAADALIMVDCAGVAWLCIAVCYPDVDGVLRDTVDALDAAGHALRVRLQFL